MGSALLAGMIDAGWAAPGELAVTDPDAGQRERLSDGIRG